MARFASLTERKLTERKPTERKLGAAVGLALALAACQGRPAPERPPTPGDQAVARVDGRTVWASDVQREAEAEGAVGPGEPFGPGSPRFGDVLEEVIDERLLAAAAHLRGLDRGALAQRRLADARDRTLEDLMVESIVGRAVNRQAEAALYAVYLQSRPPSELVHLSQIVVASPAEAAALRKALARGADFGALARQRSIDRTTRARGGDLGETPLQALSPRVAAAVGDAAIGSVVGPARVAGGWAVLRIDDRRSAAPPSLEAVRPQLVRFITYDQVKDLVLTLRGRARIDILTPPGARPTAASPASPSRIAR